jgi:hypothetical protein
VLVVDRLVAVPAEQLVGAVITERSDRGGVRKPDSAVAIHNPHRLTGRLQRGGEEIRGIDAKARQVGKRARHAKPPSTVESTPDPTREVKEAGARAGVGDTSRRVAIEAAVA